MIKEKLLKFEVKDEKALAEYLELVSIDDTDSYTEMHHICPKSMFPEYIKSDWNIVKLSMENHIKAHELLVYIYDNGAMKKAYSFITLHDMDDRMKYLTSGAYSGDKNPAKRPEVRKKISESKLGVSRPDIKNKAYFGADEKTIEIIKQKQSENRKNTVIVKWDDGRNDDYFVVSIDDERYLDGTLVPFNKGIQVKPSIETPEQIEKFLNTRNKTYEKFNSMSIEDIVEFLLEAHYNGKNIFSSGKHKKAPFAKNYSGYVKRTGHDNIEVYNMVIQRLLKA